MNHSILWLSRRVHQRLVLALAACASLAVGLASTPAHGLDAAEVDPQPVASTAVAAAALDEAQETLAGAGGRDMTLVLRDLRRHRNGLAGAERAEAAALLSRPGSNRQRDFERVRVHWNSGVATSAYVDRAGTIADRVLRTYAKAGYRAPLPDGNAGGNALLDIYLQDLGDQGVYGWCDSDDPPSGTGPYDAPAYCVLDNNYNEFPSHTPLENLQATAAHELFHAVQFAYDYYEDDWFVEATATWAEDELYDDVDDNVQYLRDSPLTKPGRSLDYGDGMGVYGDWIFFRHLTERYPEARGGLPTLVRDMWERADGAKGGPDDYSIQAVSNALSARGVALRQAWARFAAANRRPHHTYEEGRANSYPAARLSGTVALTGTNRDSGWVRRTVDHLASRTVRFTRAERMKAGALKLRLDLHDRDRGAGAVATVYRSSGRPQAISIGLDATGNGVARVDFGRDVTAVEVTLANAGIGYKDCWVLGSAWSCQGRPTDDGRKLQVRATAIR